MICQTVVAVPITDGLLLWLDATDSSTLFKDEDLTIAASPGDEVLGWMDKSGEGNHANVDFLSAPTYEKGVMGGQDAVRFDGVEADGMIISDGLFVQRPFTAFIANQYWGSTLGRTLQARDGPNWLHGLWAGQHGSFAGSWIGNDPADVDVPYVLDTTQSLDNSTVVVNGGNRVEGSGAGATGEPGFLALASGGQFANEVSDADVSEIVIYDRILTEQELTQVRDHLYAKYNVEMIEDRPPPPAQNIVIDGNLGVFTAVDEGVDFNGEFVYAINIGGPGDLEVEDAEFTDGSLFDCCQDGADVFTEDRELPEWHPNTDYGNFDLDLVMQSIRWSAEPAEIEVTLDVEAGTNFKLQLLFAESCCDRGFDIVVEDEVAVENFNVQLAQEGINNTAQGVVYSLSVTPTDDKLNIVLGNGGNEDRPNPAAPDNNPILNGLTLELGSAGIPGDFNNNGVLDADDVDLLGKAAVSQDNPPSFDLNEDGLVNKRDIDLWVGDESFAHTWYGDADLDGEFNSTDLVTVFAAGKYEDGVPMNASWAEGDWNLDMNFDSSDLVVAFSDGGYEVGPRGAVAAVPEPTSIATLLIALLLTLSSTRRCRKGVRLL